MTAGPVHVARMLTFIVSTDDTEIQGGGEKGLFRSRQDEPRVSSVSVTTLRNSLKETLEGLRDSFDGLNEVRSDLPLKEVQVSFEVTATGKIAILGTGAELAGKGAIRLTFGR